MRGMYARQAQPGFQSLSRLCSASPYRSNTAPTLLPHFYPIPVMDREDDPTARACQLMEEAREAMAAGRLAAALRLYNEAAEADPDGPGAEMAAHVRAILEFYVPPNP